MEIGKTMSVCPVCLSKIPAQRTVGDDGNIYLEKQCWYPRWHRGSMTMRWVIS